MLTSAFKQRLEQIFPSATAAALIEVHSTEAPISVRYNPYKPIPLPDSSNSVPWCRYGYYLSQRPMFTLDPHFHAGVYYVQEASSMFLEQLWPYVQESQPMKVLDISAAPGGKATHLLSLLRPHDVLVANEIVPGRAAVLKQNLAKWGVSNVLCTNNAPEHFTYLGPYFDVIVADAPCSGEGLFRKNPEALQEWSPQQVEACARRQSSLLDTLLPLLKPGGYLIYSTCTYEPAENDDQIARLVAQGQVACIPLHSLAEKYQITATEYGLQFLPHQIMGEGFYIALLQKIIDDDRHIYNATSKRKKDKPQPIPHDAMQWIDENYHLQYTWHHGMLYAMPPETYSTYALLAEHLKVTMAGTPIGEAKGNDFVPVAELALHARLGKHVPSFELTLEEALQYLKGNTPPLHFETRGYHLMCYQGKGLGWAKSLGNRWNNLYPKAWRIQMAL